MQVSAKTMGKHLLKHTSSRRRNAIVAQTIRVDCRGMLLLPSFPQKGRSDNMCCVFFVPDGQDGLLKKKICWNQKNEYFCCV